MLTDPSKLLSRSSGASVAPSTKSSRTGNAVRRHSKKSLAASINLGSSSSSSRLRRKVLKRTLYEVTKHALLKDRVNEEQDRLRANNPHLLGVSELMIPTP